MAEIGAGIGEGRRYNLVRPDAIVYNLVVACVRPCGCLHLFSARGGNGAPLAVGLISHMPSGNHRMAPSWLVLDST